MRVLRCRFLLQPAFPAWGVGACALLRALGPYPVTPGWGCLWQGVVLGSPLAGFLAPPFFLLSSWPQGGGSVGVVLGPVVLWLCAGGRRLSRSWPPWSLPPLPPVFEFPILLLSMSMCPVASYFSGGGVRRRARRVFTSGPQAAVWSWWAAVSAWASSGWSVWPPGVLSAGSVGPAFRGAWRGVVRLCEMGAQLRGCAMLSSRYDSVPLADGCVFVVGGGFSPSVFVFLLFRGGMVACSSLCLPWAGGRTGQQTVWLTGSLLAFWVAARRAPAPWVVWVMYAHRRLPLPLWAGSVSAGCAVAPAGFGRSSVRGGGAVPCLPAPAVPVPWWRV